VRLTDLHSPRNPTSMYRPVPFFLTCDAIPRTKKESSNSHFPNFTISIPVASLSGKSPRNARWLIVNRSLAGLILHTPHISLPSPRSPRCLLMPWIFRFGVAPNRNLPDGPLSRYVSAVPASTNCAVPELPLIDYMTPVIFSSPRPFTRFLVEIWTRTPSLLARFPFLVEKVPVSPLS